jgi:hypothetical protein
MSLMESTHMAYTTYLGHHLSPLYSYSHAQITSTTRILQVGGALPHITT